jgi:dimethylargininase
MRIAITREVSSRIGACELTHLPRVPIDVERARRQHAHYEECLELLGCHLRRLSEEKELPDGVFVEDTAVVLEDVAVIARPGAPSRRPEISSVASALASFRELLAIYPPGILDGGDVLPLGKTIYIGLSARSNDAAVDQMRDFLSTYGYRILSVAVEGCLHLKSAVTPVAPDILLVNPEWVDPDVFEGMHRIEVDPNEPFGSNALLVGDTVLYPASFGATRRKLESHGLCVLTVDVSELAKAEGGVTCCSLVFDA